jgi:hypothetical protein
MNLPELQRILARIATSPDLREQFLGDPEGVGYSSGWDIGLTRRLATIPAHQLRHYGESLINKRCREASRWLPLTFKALGDSRFRTRFRAFAHASMPRGPARHLADAIGFADMLRGARPDLPRHPAWLADLSAYEAASLRAGTMGSRIILLRLGHSPRDLLEAAVSGNPASTVAKRPTLIVWVRLTRRGPSRQFLLAIPRF